MQFEHIDLQSGATLDLYLRSAADEMPNAITRPLVIVIPGGGYAYTSPREADPVALQFAAAGYHTAIFDYGVGKNAQNYLPMRQLDEALAAVRANAAKWNIVPDKIAVCGFSAGGHLALAGAVLNVPGMQKQQRPNAVILSYPVVTAGKFAHRGSIENLAGTTDYEAQQAFTLEDKVTPAAPPMFIWHTMEDGAVPVENTLLLLNALHAAHVPCEVHLYEKGGHGTSISTVEVDAASAHRHTWVRLAIEWLDDTFNFHV